MPEIEEFKDKSIREEVINIDRVARVVKGGRRFSFRALVVVGDEKGQVGVGVSKGSDVQKAITKATAVAKKNMKKMNLAGDTIPHDSQTRVSGAVVLLKRAAPGTGLKAGGVIRTVLEVAGVKDILSKSIGSSNKINIAYATVKALDELELKENWVTS